MSRVLSLVTVFALAFGLGSLTAQGPGGMMPADRKLVAQFDQDKNNRLSNDERKAARAFLEGEAAGRPGGPGGRGGGGRGGRGMEPASPGITVSPSDVKPATTPLYDLGTLRTLFLTFENADWEAELAAFNNTDVEVPATLMVDGKSYPQVGVHFRGASSYFMIPAASKRSLNLALDFANDQQALLGYRTLNLLNSNGDPTFMRPVLYQQIARNYIKAGHANFVRVVVNGENWGVYSSTQQFNREWLRDHFSTTEGVRWTVPGSPGGRGGLEYLGDDPAPYKVHYEIKSKDTPKAWADFIQMTKVLNTTPPEKLEAALSPLLDIDGALKFLALEVALVNSDGYWVRASDYNIYQDAKGRFHILPHDTNETFYLGGGPGGGRGPGGPGGPGGPPPGAVAAPPPGAVGAPPPPPPPPPGGSQPPMQGRGGAGPGGGPGRAGVALDVLTGSDNPARPLLSKLLAVPALRTRYLGYINDIADRWLDWKTLGPMVQKHRALIEAEVMRDTKKLTSNAAFTAGIDGETGSLKAFADQRRAVLLKK